MGNRSAKLRACPSCTDQNEYLDYLEQVIGEFLSREQEYVPKGARTLFKDTPEFAENWAEAQRRKHLQEIKELRDRKN